MTKVWMWPQNPINSKTVVNDLRTLEEIELYFSQLYAPFKVVYFARARIALTAISAVAGLSRPKLTFVQPFSSHCVLSAIAHLSTPTTITPEHTDAQVIYHQWGHKTIANTRLFNAPLVEDAVDSLITSNRKEELFPNNAPFCIVSLPKVCQAAIGSIVICQNDSDFEALREQREQMHTRLTQDKALTYLDEPPLTESVLQAVPTLVPVLPSDIKSEFEQAIANVRANLAIIKDIYAFLDVVFATEDRLPANIVVKTSQCSEQELYSPAPFEVIEKQRTYFDYQSLQCEKVWLLPSHCQANWSK